jgi:hypothetical protein
VVLIDVRLPLSILAVPVRLRRTLGHHDQQMKMIELEYGTN